MCVLHLEPISAKDATTTIDLLANRRPVVKYGARSDRPGSHRRHRWEVQWVRRRLPGVRHAHGKVGLAMCSEVY